MPPSHGHEAACPGTTRQGDRTQEPATLTRDSNLRPRSQLVKGIITEEGHYEFTRTPFGLIKSGATLTKGLRRVLHGIENVDVYVDDIIIYIEECGEHLQTVEKVLKCLQDANLTLKSSKSLFGQREIEFIGHVISEGKNQPNKNNVNKILKARERHRTKKVQSFLGLTGFYRNFIPNYSAIASPMND